MDQQEQQQQTPETPEQIKVFVVTAEVRATKDILVLATSEDEAKQKASAHLGQDEQIMSVSEKTDVIS